MKTIWTIWKHALGSFDEEDGYDAKNENWVAAIRTVLVLTNIACAHIIMWNIIRTW